VCRWAAGIVRGLGSITIELGVRPPKHLTVLSHREWGGGGLVALGVAILFATASRVTVARVMVLMSGYFIEHCSTGMSAAWRTWICPSL